MTPEQLSQLHVLAMRFRLAITELGQQNVLLTLRDFPHGSCGDVALLFGRYLRQNGLGTPAYTNGLQRNGPWTHAWLELDGMVIDVAADGVPGAPASVIIAERSPWHLQFEHRRSQDAAIEPYDEPTRTILLEAYEQIIAKITDSFL